MNAWNSKTPTQNLNYLSKRQDAGEEDINASASPATTQYGSERPIEVDRNMSKDKTSTPQHLLTGYLYKHSGSRQVNDANRALVVE